MDAPQIQALDRYRTRFQIALTLLARIDLCLVRELDYLDLPLESFALGERRIGRNDLGADISLFVDAWLGSEASDGRCRGRDLEMCVSREGVIAGITFLEYEKQNSSFGPWSICLGKLCVMYGNSRIIIALISSGTP